MAVAAAEEETTTRIKRRLPEVGTEQLVMRRIKEAEVAEVEEAEVEREIKTARSQNLINKRKIKIQLKTNSIVCLEPQLLRTLKSRKSTQLLWLTMLLKSKMMLSSLNQLSLLLNKERILQILTPSSPRKSQTGTTPI